MSFTPNATNSICSAGIFIVCLVGAIVLARILRSCEETDDSRRRLPAWLTPVGVALISSCVLLIPGIHNFVPQNWIGRGAFEPRDPQLIPPPSFARLATRDDRMVALAELRDAIQHGNPVSGALPETRAGIEWVAVEQWQVPGSPGIEFQFVRETDSNAFTLSEPFQIDGEQLVLQGGVDQ